MSRKRKYSNLQQRRIQMSNKEFWSDKEIVNLIGGVQAYGSRETKKIAELIQTKDENAVKQFLKLESAKVRLRIAKENGRTYYLNPWNNPKPEELQRWPCVRKWKKIIHNEIPPYLRKNDYSKIILKEIFESYEKSSESNNPERINQKAIYKYLLDCLQGRVPGEISPLDSGIVLLLMGQLKEMQRDIQFEDEISFIKSFEKTKSFVPIRVKSEFEERTNKRALELKSIVEFPESTSKNESDKNISSFEVKNVNINNERHVIKVSEEMFCNISKHRKLVHSFNPLNVPMRSLVKEQAYVQIKSELTPRTSFKPILKTDIFN